MPKIAYTPIKRFSDRNLAKIEFAIEVLDDLTSRGYTPTLRQVYYRFVAADKIPNTQREYKNLGTVLNDARLCGLIDWDHMVDRTRNVQGESHWDSPAQIIRACANQYRIDKWEGQEHYVEVWVEKDAQIDVISKACGPLDVDFFSCRGYVSQSEMWSAAQRLLGRIEEGRRPVIVHLGDHDPSGIDMTRDIAARMRVFDAEVKVVRIALNMPQIEELNPPPNPAKVTDSRADGYITRYGTNSWELDALDPDYTVDLIEAEVLKFRDDGLFYEREDLEKQQREQLQDVSDNWGAVVAWLKRYGHLEE